jgi:hypothetical protein
VDKHERKKMFINRERLRRRLMNTKAGETICLNSDETQMLVFWIAGLENKTKLLEAEKEMIVKRIEQEMRKLPDGGQYKALDGLYAGLNFALNVINGKDGAE